MSGRTRNPGAAVIDSAAEAIFSGDPAREDEARESLERLVREDVRRPVATLDGASGSPVVRNDVALRVWRNRQSRRVTRAVLHHGGHRRVVAVLRLPRPLGAPVPVYVLGARLPPPADRIAAARAFAAELAGEAAE